MGKEIRGTPRTLKQAIQNGLDESNEAESLSAHVGDWLRNQAQPLILGDASAKDFWKKLESNLQNEKKSNPTSGILSVEWLLAIGVAASVTYFFWAKERGGSGFGQRNSQMVQTFSRYPR